MCGSMDGTAGRWQCCALQWSAGVVAWESVGDLVCESASRRRPWIAVQMSGMGGMTTWPASGPVLVVDVGSSSSVAVAVAVAVALWAGSRRMDGASAMQLLGLCAKGARPRRAGAELRGHRMEGLRCDTAYRLPPTAHRPPHSTAQHRIPYRHPARSWLVNACSRPRNPHAEPCCSARPPIATGHRSLQNPSPFTSHLARRAGPPVSDRPTSALRTPSPVHAPQLFPAAPNTSLPITNPNRPMVESLPCA